MDQEQEEDILQLQTNIATLNALLTLLAFCVHEILCQANRRWWVRSVYSEENRASHAAFRNLHTFFRLEDHEMFYKYMRMEESDFAFLFEKVKDKIKKKDTRYRKALPAELRLAAVLV